MEDEEIINLFLARSDNAVQMLQEKYGRISQAIAGNILTSCEDAEECVNDAYLQVWNSIPPNHPESLSAYVLRIVRNSAISRLRYNSSMKRSAEYTLAYEEIAESVMGESSPEQRLESKALLRSVEQFLDGLSKRDRILFVRRYWFADTYSTLAELTGMTEKNVSVRLTRIRRQLKKYLIKQGVLE